MRLSFPLCPLLLFILLIGLTTLTCKLDLGPSARDKEPEVPDSVIVAGQLSFNGVGAESCVVLALPYEQSLSTILSHVRDLREITDLSSITLAGDSAGMFRIALTTELFWGGLSREFFLVTGLGGHQADEYRVIPVTVDITKEPCDLRSAYRFTVSAGDAPTRPYAARVDLPLVSAIKLYMLGHGYEREWHPDTLIDTSLSVTAPIRIRWAFDGAVSGGTDYTRYIFFLWSFDRGLLLTYPPTYTELLLEPSDWTSLTFPMDLYQASFLTPGEEYRLTVVAITDANDPTALEGVSSELFWGGRFRVR